MQNYNWIGSRQRDNFGYSLGQKIFFGEDCENSLVISDETDRVTEGISNSAVIIEKGNRKIIPTSQTKEIVSEGTRIIKGKIFYLKPVSITEKETLPYLNKGNVQPILSDFYGISVEEMKKVESPKGNNRIYYLSTRNGQDYILKYMGRIRSVLGLRADILGNSFFPRIIPGNNGELEVRIDNGFYTLEEFLRGKTLIRTKGDYFQLVGREVALFHNELNRILRNSKSLESSLDDSNFFSESNIISMLLDLGSEDSQVSSGLRREAYAHLDSDLLKGIALTPNQIIHGDLNNSNLLWEGNSVRMVDTENLCFSKRIKEFLPILLFNGNFEQPMYIPGSLRDLVQNYDVFADKKLTPLEKEILPSILRLFLVKLYTLYSIRRNGVHENYGENIPQLIKSISGEPNVN